jgi:lactoylglutathione lyase
MAEQSKDCYDRAHASEPECGSSGPAHPGARLRHSLAFYIAVGYTVVGTVEGTGFGSLTMLRLPGDSFVTIELVHDPVGGVADLGTGVNDLVVQVESLNELVAGLAAQRIASEPPALPASPNGLRTTWITDPDGYRIELVQWPAMLTALPRPTSPERADVSEGT